MNNPAQVKFRTFSMSEPKWIKVNPSEPKWTQVNWCSPTNPTRHQPNHMDANVCLICVDLAGQVYILADFSLAKLILVELSWLKLLLVSESVRQP